MLVLYQHLCMCFFVIARLGLPLSNTRMISRSRLCHCLVNMLTQYLYTTSMLTQYLSTTSTSWFAISMSGVDKSIVHTPLFSQDAHSVFVYDVNVTVCHKYEWFISQVFGTTNTVDLIAAVSQ
jgi:hypothetical protein